MAKKILLSLMLVALFASCIRERWEPEHDRQFIVEEGQLVPAEFFNMEMELFGGGTVDFSELRGKVIMIQFATYHCNMTRAKMQHIEPQIWQKHKDNDDFRLFGIVRGEPDRNTPENIQSLINITGVTYPIGVDLEREIFELFARPEGGATRDILIDRNGKIVMLTRYFGRDNMREFNALVAKIDELLTD